MIKFLTEKGMRILPAAVLALFAFSCQVPESEREPEFLEITPAKSNPSALDASITVNVRCDLHWSAELLDTSWGSIKDSKVTEGTGGSFTLNLGVNKSEDPRENTIIVKAGKAEIRKTITQGGLATYFNPRSLVLSGTQDAYVTFTPTSSWTAKVTEGEDWIDLKNPSGEVGSKQLSVAAKDANENVGPRSGVISITIGGDSFDISVVQGQTDVILSEDTKLNYAFEAQEFSVATRFNVEYKVETTVPWIVHQTTKAPLYEGQESFVIEENPDKQARSGQIRFTGGDAKPLVVTITQESRDPILFVTEYGFYGISGANYIYTANGWNQRARQITTDGVQRYRLFNAAALSVTELSGLNKDAQKGDSIPLHLSVKTKNKIKVSNDFTATLLYMTQDRVWCKVDENTYFVLFK